MFPTFKLINGVKTWTNSHWATTSLIKGKKGREFLKSITTDFTQPRYVNIFNIYLYNILNANQTSKQVLKHSWPEKLYNASSRQEVKVKRERYRMKYLGFLISLNTLTCFHTDLKYDVFHFKLLRDHQLCSFDCWESPKVWICKDQIVGEKHFRGGRQAIHTCKIPHYHKMFDITFFVSADSLFLFLYDNGLSY